MIENNRNLWSNLKTSRVTVSVARRPSPLTQETYSLIFRVSKMIDTGRGRAMLTLDQVALEPEMLKGNYVRKSVFDEEPQCSHLEDKTRSAPKNRLSMPGRIANFSLIYTSRKHGPVKNARSILPFLYPQARIEEIGPEVLAAGDLLVMDYAPCGRSRITTLRVMNS